MLCFDYNQAPYDLQDFRTLQAMESRQTPSADSERKIGKGVALCVHLGPPAWHQVRVDSSEASSTDTCADVGTATSTKACSVHCYHVQRSRRRGRAFSGTVWHIRKHFNHPQAMRFADPPGPGRFTSRPALGHSDLKRLSACTYHDGLHSPSMGLGWIGQPQNTT